MDFQRGIIEDHEQEATVMRVLFEEFKITEN